MSQLSVCRLCLGCNMRMFSIVNTPTQQIYEKLTNAPLETVDGRPVMACYLCYQQLNKCRALQQMSSNVEQLLTQILGNGLELSEKSIGMIDRESHSLTWALAVSQMETIASVQPSHVEVPVLEEEIKCEKEEVKEVEMLSQTEETECLPTDNMICDTTDSEDDVPLQKISIKMVNERNENTNDKGRRKDTSNVLKDIKPDAREILLTQEEQLAHLVERSKSLNYINSPFKCELCFKGFVDTKAYENHQEKHNERSGSFECGVCRMRYQTSRNLRTHVASSHARQYECNKCQHRSHTANQARVHEKWHSGFTYECQLCSQTFKKPTSYLTHMRKRHPTEHVCHICGESFVGKHGLLMHKNKAHRRDDQKPEQPSTNSFCVECNIQFASTDAWIKHVLSSVKHTLTTNTRSRSRSVTPGRCSDAQCEPEPTLWVPPLPPPLPTAPCLVCGTEVPAGSLRTHVSQHVAGAKPARVRPSPLAHLPCEQCGANFVNRSKLQAHIRRIHLGLKYNKNIVCEVCGKKCTSNAGLKYHQRTHTGERPYSCPTCHKRFSDNNQLRIHTRTHTGERPYCCAACGKRFSQRPALNRHYRVHTGAKPYDCQFCSKTFSQSNSLKLHVNTVHLKLRPNNKKKVLTNEEKKL